MSWEDEPLAELAKRPLTKDEEKAIKQAGWNDLKNVPCKYLDRVAFSKMEGTHLIAPPRPSPYANIIVQLLGSSETAFIQIAHKMDFYNLWLLEVQGVLGGTDFDVIIRHRKPSGIKKVFASVLPHDPERSEVGFWRQKLSLDDKNHACILRESRKKQKPESLAGKSPAGIRRHRAPGDYSTTGASAHRSR